MQKLWIVPSYEGAGALKSLILNLNELVEANIVTNDALFVEAPDEYADLIQRIATQAEMLVSKESEIETTEITGMLPWKATLNVPREDNNAVPLMLPETHPGYTGIPGKVNTEALLDGWEPEADKAGADGCAVLGQPICQNCGEAFAPKRKNSKFCDREACEKDRKRKYAKKYYDQNNGKTPAAEPAAEPAPEPETVDDFYADAPLASSLDADRIKLFPYEIMDGGDKGRRLDGTTLGVWLSIGRLPVGTLVNHDKRGLHIVDRDGKRKTAILRKTYQKHVENEVKA